MYFNNKRSCRKPVFKKAVVDDTHKFLPPPPPAGTYPFHLKLQEVCSAEARQKMVFHMVGDTGSALQPEFQQLVVAEMISHFKQARQPADEPAFLYHLGDVVYHFGEAEEYYRQFFKPYDLYPAPIFAIPGNHDSDVNPDAKQPYQSLDAFKHVFCDSKPGYTPLAKQASRKTMTQPNVYWTLETPLADIIGLYSNVPKFGKITAEQRSWFINELKTIAAGNRDKLLIVCIHHAPYSADTNHGASREMINFLEHAFQRAGIQPDIVMSGHVHNYQRFSKRYPNGKTVPYIVAGAGGYSTLFTIASPGDENYTDESELFDEVCLENYCDDKHGFLKMNIEKIDEAIELTGEYYTIPLDSPSKAGSKAGLFDTFKVRVSRHAMQQKVSAGE